MKNISDYLRLITFLAGVLVGIQIPGFTDLYGENLRARSDEASRSISPFQRDADRYFDGSLEGLIAHYRANGDPVFTAGGQNIETQARRSQLLGNALKEFHRHWYSPYLQVFINPVAEIREDVWRHYNYSAVLDGRAIVAGLGAGVLCALLADLLLSLCCAPFRLIGRLRRSRRRPPAEETAAET